MEKKSSRLKSTRPRRSLWYCR